jgi:hypothetical protein
MTKQQPTRFAALVDVENAVIRGGHLLSADYRRALFMDLDTELSSMPVRVAAGKHVLLACAGELASRGWGVSLVPTTPDAADLALLEAGRHFARSGATDLVVVSGDHAFASLAEMVRLHVIAHRHKLSAALRLAADTVTYLPDPYALAAASA